MRINKYNEYIIESILIQLINESEVVFRKDFKELLDDMQTGFDDSVDKICNILIDIVKSNRDLDIVQNYIGLSDEIDKVSFIPDNKVNDLDIKVTGNIVGVGLKNELHSIQKDAKLPLEGMLFLPVNEFMENDIINSWKIAKKINMALVPDTSWNQYTLYYLQNTEDPTKFITTYSYNNDIKLPYEYIDNGVNKIKIGRYINKLLDLYFSSNPERNKFTDSDIEKFTNKFISTMEYKRNALNHFKVVKGEDIKHWYLSDNYAGQTGQLGQSCMRYSKCQDYFKIYIENPDVCQLVIFTDKTDRLLGRALLWTLEDGDLYMDRIYTTKDSNVELFRKWGNLNGYKKQYPTNSYELKVKVTPKNHEFYPYMDTFKYYKPEDGLLSNTMFKSTYLLLQEHDGQAERIEIKTNFIKSFFQ